jgi:hypothetical protein
MTAVRREETLASSKANLTFVFRLSSKMGIVEIIHGTPRVRGYEGWHGEVAPEKCGTGHVALAEAGQRVAMGVSSLHAGAEGAEVERLLGRPTITTFLDARGSDRSLVYADETVRTCGAVPDKCVSFGSAALDALRRRACCA